MKNNFYPNVDSNPNFSTIEEKIIKYWQDGDFFNKSVTNRRNNKSYVFYDGPPFANGLPHYGHLLTGFVKDSVARFQTMIGNKVERRFGWDCHGLPAELEVEKTIKISGRKAITDYGIDQFNQQCRKSVMKYAGKWQEYVKRSARWVDFDNDYKTMDISYMESTIWAFKQLFDKGLIYQSMRVMPYSWAAETPLSNFETRLDNSYRERADKSVTVKFTINSPINFIDTSKFSSVCLLAWTTTPWTLPSNLALAVNKDMEYICVAKAGECFILSASSLTKYTKIIGDDIIAKITGQDLVGLDYDPLFPYFKNNLNSFIILDADFVIEGDGTGVVHLAPGFGEDDQLVCDTKGIELVCPVDERGRFTDEVAEYKGILVFDAIDDIIKQLKQEKKWLFTEQYIHNYPHCWRTDQPLIYKAVPSWYVEVTKIKDQMVEVNKQINWIPSHIKDGLFGKWLENARDWSISRNRFWGTPIPVWQSDDPKYPRIDVYGSIAELEKDFGVEITDLHRPFVDSLIRPNPDDPTGKSKMVRVTDIFDCWFESGSMPFAQLHYPFNNKQQFEQNFPADFIVEYTAQTRGWFYTLVVLSTALFGKAPFLNCICHGVILDENGQKLSKRLKNYADPLEVFKRYGADAMRYLMLSSPVLKGNELLIDKSGDMVKDVLRLSIKPIWNAYNFFTLYANSDDIVAQIDYSSSNMMDQYILAKLKIALTKIKNNMLAYEISLACNAIDDFFEVLNNWYIRRTRNRFWQSKKDSDKLNAYNTLYAVLLHMVEAAAPLLPITTEEIYLGLKGSTVNDGKTSIHLSKFPNILAIEIQDEDRVVADMDMVREICSAALAVRNNQNIRIRQPLDNLTIYIDHHDLSSKHLDLICDELNIKNIIIKNLQELKASYNLKVKFPLVGRRLPGKMKDIIAAQKQGKWQKNSQGNIAIAGEILFAEEAQLLFNVKEEDGFITALNGRAVIKLNLHLTDDLINEGVARDLVRLIQQSRKELDLNITQRITVKLRSSNYIKNVVNNFNNYIAEQTLAKFDFTYDNSDNADYNSEYQIDQEKIMVKIVKQG